MKDIERQRVRICVEHKRNRKIEAIGGRIKMSRKKRKIQREKCEKMKIIKEKIKEQRDIKRG